MRRFSRRESEILDALYVLGEASVSDVLTQLSVPPSYNAVRTTLGILVEKGAVCFREEGRKFIYAPVLPETRAWRSGAQRLAEVFFGGSVSKAALAMLKMSDIDLYEDELKALEQRLLAERDEGKRAHGQY